MPRGFSSLTGAQIAAVRAWIDAGAPREGVVAGVPDLSRLPRDARHHFILYRIGSDTVPPPFGLWDLDPTDPGQAIGIFRRQLIVGSQCPDATFQFLEGVAISMPAGAAYELNSHFVNTTGINTLIGEVYINLHTVPTDQVRQVAKPVFFSNFGLSISPGQTVTSTIDWTLPEDIHVVLLSSHMHRHGKLFGIFLGGKRIYRNLHWNDPENLLFNPPLEVKTGDKVRFECTHENADKDFTLRFGFTAENDEMCILLGYYYTGEK